MNKYIAMPWHFILPIFLFAVGIKAMLYEEVFLKLIGISFAIGSFGSYLVILVSGIVPVYTEYWIEINKFAELMLKNNNPELWAALGFRQTTEFITKNTNQGEAYPSWEKVKLPVSDAVMATIAKGMITEGLPFSEDAWVTKRHVCSQKKFRELQQIFKDKKYVRQNHPDNSRQGVRPTDLGKPVFYQYAGMPLPSPIALKVVKTQ